MHYPDLSFYRTGGHNDIFDVYPNVKNIGWLDKETDFAIGTVSIYLLKKLKEIIFLDIKNQDDVKNGCFDESNSVIVDQMLTRGSPHQCSFCGGAVINVSPDDLEVYSGVRVKVLGLNEICIPSFKTAIVYACPTLIYHYIKDHEYFPPSEFMEALNAFDLFKHYNSNEDSAFDLCVDVPAKDIDDLTADNVTNYPESEEC